MANADWFLSTEERDNPWTRLAHRHGGRSWTSGNRADVLVHGATYFARLRELVEAQGEGDLLMFTDWRGDPDERMGDDDVTVAQVFAAAARRGVVVKGLFWRSHWDRLAYSQEENRSFADDVRHAGGEVILDMRVRALGSHHQKLVVLRHRDRPQDDVAFVGGIDLCHTRRDDADHRGDPQPLRMGDVWGPTPAWHDAMVEVHGPAVGDVEATFRERWEDPTPPVHHPVARLDSWLHQDDEHADPLPPQGPDPDPCGDVHVQVLRTYADNRPRYPFAPDGERSIARAYDKAVGRAESIVYLEDQYFWSGEVVSCFATALEEHRDLRLVVVLASRTLADTTVANAAAMGSRIEAMRDVLDAGGDRVGVYALENSAGTPIYVHSKVCVVDDVWMTVGSDNVNRRSWTYDSECTCAMVDEVHDWRAPKVVRSDGDPARRLARETRLTLMREHLGRADHDDADLADPVSAFDAFRESAARLDGWYAAGCAGPRPAGRLRVYGMPDVPRWQRLLGDPVYRVADDPDGRPRRLKRTARF